MRIKGRITTTVTTPQFPVGEPKKMFASDEMARLYDATKGALERGSRMRAGN